MAIKYLTNVDFNKNQALNMLLQVVASDPAAPSDGQVWYRSDDDTIRFRSGGVTRKLHEVVSDGTVSVTDNGDGTTTVGLDKAAVDALGVDAATLDGLSPSHYLDFTNFTNLPSPTITLSGDVSGSVTLTDLTGGTLDVTIADDSHSHVIANVDGLQNELDSKIDSTEKGSANGVAELDAGGQVPVSQLPTETFGGLSYQGTWDADSNTPTLSGGSVPAAGTFYKVGTNGSTSIGGISDWVVGDWVISDGTDWQKLDNTDQVTSVAGRGGAVTLGISDIAGLQTELDAKPEYFSLEMASAASGPLSVTHNLGTNNVIVEVFDVTNDERVMTDVAVTSNDSIQIGYVGSEQLRVVVHGQ